MNESTVTGKMMSYPWRMVTGEDFGRAIKRVRGWKNPITEQIKAKHAELFGFKFICDPTVPAGTIRVVDDRTTKILSETVAS